MGKKCYYQGQKLIIAINEAFFTNIEVCNNFEGKQENAKSQTLYMHAQNTSFKMCCQ